MDQSGSIMVLLYMGIKAKQVISTPQTWKNAKVPLGDKIKIHNWAFILTTGHEFDQTRAAILENGCTKQTQHQGS